MSFPANGSFKVGIRATVAANIAVGELVKLTNNGGTPQWAKAAGAHEAHAVATTAVAAAATAQVWLNEFHLLGPVFRLIAGEALAITDAGANLISGADARMEKSGNAQREFVFIPMATINNPTAAAADGDEILAMFYPLQLDTDT